jgi:alpha-amylase/alpha-mannosidase (GH57 family)
MRFKLAFALHNHQPVGNFTAVFDEAHKKCYLPFLELIKQYPKIRFSLHQSGILWDWQKEHYPDFFKLVGEMVDRGQMELLSGAFYEPILCAIPERDQAGQLKMLNAYLKDHFEFEAQGMWLAERVWEPHLPRVLKLCGLNYLPLDDTHFKYAGLREEELFGTYITEEAGQTVTLLPIIQKLRYLIPVGKPTKIM